MIFTKRSPQPKLNWRLAIVVLLLGGGLVTVAYVSAQQAVRLGANAAPATMAATTAKSIESGSDPQTTVTATVPGLGQGTVSSVIIYDEKLNPIGTNIRGYTDKPATLTWRPPAGVFNYDANNQDDNRFTWEPVRGLRLAAVVVKADKTGYVLAASNLAEPERTEGTLTLLALGGLTGVLVVAVLALIL